MEILIDYQIQLINFPSGKTKEAVTENEDGSYTIFIEDNLPPDERQKVFLHALKHIIGNDFSGEDIQKIEYNTHI